MKYNARQELAVQILSQAVYGVATGYTSPTAPLAVYNAIAGAGVYAVGEKNTPFGWTLAVIKLISLKK